MEYLETLTDREDLCTYLVGQKEQAPETGTIHLQLYAEFKRPIPMSRVKSLFRCDSIHVEAARAGHRANHDYVTKEDSRVTGIGAWRIETGLPRRGGSVGLIKMITERASLRAIAEAHPTEFLKKASGITKMRALFSEKRSWPMEIEIYFGESGTGKSFDAHNRYPEAYTFMYPDTGRIWWDHYDGQETVIFDEFRCQFKFDYLLKLMDRYPMKVQYKGGVMEFTSRRLIFTTNWDPATWYGKVPDRSPLIRRLNQFAKIFTYTRVIPEGEVPPMPERELRTEPIVERTLSFAGYGGA